MFTLVVFIAAVYGLANAIAVLKAGALIRKAVAKVPVLSDFVKCPPCLSFWIGMAVSAWVLSPASQVCAPGWRPIVIDGLAASGIVWLLHVAAERTAFGLDNL